MTARIPFWALATAAVFGGAATGLRLAVVDPLASLRREIRLGDDVLSSPGPDVLGVASMEHRIGWSDVVWLELVQELGKFIEGTEASYDRVQRWANIAVDLDPRYFVVYYASAIHLIVYGKRAAAADQLLAKGRKVLPAAWELPFLLGYNAYFLHAEPRRAAQFWQEAVALPGTPHFLPSLAARARFQAGDENGSIAILEEMLSHLEGPHRTDAELRLKLLKSEFILRRYDEACRRFLAEKGVRPRDGRELHAEGFVSDPPLDLLESAIEIDEKCRARTRHIRVREDEAKGRLGSQGAGQGTDGGRKEQPVTGSGTGIEGGTRTSTIAGHAR